MKNEYSTPQIKDLGTVSDQTLTEYEKTGLTGDVIKINGQSIAVPGSSGI